MNVIGLVVPIFLITHRQIQCLSERYLKTLEPINRLRSFMDQFVHCIHAKVCRYQVFNRIVCLKNIELTLQCVGK